MPEKILVVDDEPHMLRLIEVSLRKGEFEVVTASNGHEALVLADQEKPSLIIMDVLMPELDGLATLERLKASEATQRIPVIMLTSKGHAMTRVEAERSGATMFLTKPFSPTQLLATAHRLITDADNH